MSTYLGFDVLDANTHNMRDSIRESFDRAGAMAGTALGKRHFDDFAGQPFPHRTFSWYASGRPAIDALRAFRDARMGREVPFWTPTFCAELTMAADATSAQSALTVASIDYTRFLFPVPARRHLAIFRPGGTFLIRKVVASVDNGNGTETLALGSGLGEDLAAARTLVSFLTLCRLEADDFKIIYSADDYAEAEIPFREIPLEVPA
jgi:hypothetical protein